MFECNPVRTLVEVGTKLSKNDVGDLVDSTYFKQISCQENHAILKGHL